MSNERTPKQETKQCVHEVTTKSTSGVTEVHSGVTEVHSVKYEGKHTRFVYNSNVNPSQVNALLAKKLTKISTHQNQINPPELKLEQFGPV